ncbi:hypothetical protein Tco_0742668 [Tanacetum coccineum]
MDILQNTNFFRAFTASASVPSIYIQQFCNTLTYEAKNEAYSFQLDEDRFKLDANLLREALEITPIDQAHQFVSPPSGDAIMDFVNELGYTKEIHFVSRMVVNNLYQPWRAILSMINQYQRLVSSCLNKITELGKSQFVPKAEEKKVEKNDQKIEAEKGGKKKPATVKQLKPKPIKEKSSKPTLA